jgi:glycosyltransferase involved in cell wall biosynthesis
VSSAARLKLLFDATRLLSRAHYSTPTGIDRVDLAYAQALASSPAIDTRFVAFDPLGAYRLGDRPASRLLTHTAQRWQATGSRPSAAFSALCAWLAAPAGTPAPPIHSPVALPQPALAALHQLRFAGSHFRRDCDADAVYVNTSHGRLFKPSVARWMSRQRAGGVFFVHDLIPIEYPHYNRPGEAERHAARLRLISRHARLVIVNSAATQVALMRWWAAQQLPQPPITVIPLGVAPAFTRDGAVPVSATPYFIVIGTIEPRKNHQLLLRIWQTMAGNPQGPQRNTPRLLLVGRRGWENQATFDLLDDTPALRPLVAETAGLSDGEIAQLLRGARALLAPSFAEGYGLPVAEALASGVPVIASDLPAHHEVGGRYIETLDPLDPTAWLQAIHDYADPANPRWLHQLATLSSYRAPSWSQHVRMAVGAILASCGEADGAC